MPVEICDLTLVVAADELLSSIWYSDGSGAANTAGVPLSTCPKDYKLCEVNLQGGLVFLRLKAKEKSS